MRYRTLTVHCKIPEQAAERRPNSSAHPAHTTAAQDIPGRESTLNYQLTACAHGATNH